MKNTTKLAPWLKIAAGTALFAAGAGLIASGPAHSTRQTESRRGFEWITSAFAATNLSPSSFSDLNTSAQASQMTKWLYFLVNGPTTDYTISGPSAGYVGIVTTFTEAFGQVIEDAGLLNNTANSADCTNIRTSGSTTYTSGGNTWEIVLGTGTSVVPSHFQSRAGATFANKISVSKNGTAFLRMEFSCTSREDYAGYMLLVQGGTDRDMETYFERNVSTGAATVDFFMVNNDGTGEKTWTRFRTTDGDSYTMHMIRTTTSQDSHVFSVVGTRSTNKALIGGVNVTNSTAIDESTALSASFPSTTTCVDISSDTATTGCQSALSTPAAGPLGSMTSGVSSYSTSVVQSMVLSTL